MARFASQAEYYRHHRRCMTLALELSVTPREAEKELAVRELRDRAQEREARLQAAQRPLFPPAEPTEEPRPEPWMMRD